MIQKLIASYGHLAIVLLILIVTLGASGSRIRWEQMPDPRARVLSYFTQVPDGYVRVIQAIDGDTITVELDGKEETVRLLGVDTPETKDPRRSVQCFGHQASDYTKKLITGRPVRLVSDPLESDRDAYQRLLRYVYFEDGTTLNERLVYDGYAFAYERFPTEKLERLKELESDAREHKRGLWGGCEVTIKNKGKSKSTQSVKE